MSKKSEITRRQRIRDAVQSVLLISLIGILVFLAYLAARALNLTDVHRLAEFILSWGALGPVILILLAIIAALTGIIPSYPLTLLAGAIWGVWLGSFYVLIGIMSGAVLSFLIARYSLFPWLDRALRTHLKFYGRITDKYVTRFVFISRLLPFFIFELISYGAGLTRIKFSHYFWATLIGTIPVTLFLAWSGRVAITEGGPILWILTGAGVVFLFAFPWYIETYNPLGLKEKILIPEPTESLSDT